MNRICDCENNQCALCLSITSITGCVTLSNISPNQIVSHTRVHGLTFYGIFNFDYQIGATIVWHRIDTIPEYMLTNYYYNLVDEFAQYQIPFNILFQATSYNFSAILPTYVMPNRMFQLLISPEFINLLDQNEIQHEVQWYIYEIDFRNAFAMELENQREPGLRLPIAPLNESGFFEQAFIEMDHDQDESFWMDEFMDISFEMDDGFEDEF